MTSIKVALFLAYKRISRSSFLTNALVIFVMLLTFLNLLFVRGILIGLPAGAINTIEEKYFGDIYISALPSKKHITRDLLIDNALAQNQNVAAYSKRYLILSSIVSNSDARIRNDERLDSVTVTAVGIDEVAENSVTNIKESIIEGRFFEKNSKDEIVLGSDLLTKYASPRSDGSSTLDDAELGSKVEITINGITNEVTVVGYVRAKVSEIDVRVLMSQDLFRQFVSSEDFKPDEYAVRLQNVNNLQQTQIELLDKGLAAVAQVQGPDEYRPEFIEDIVQTFAILGDAIGVIALAVASITVFIVIFVTAITKQKYIGILKGIGISSTSIELSYIFQSLFYSFIGSGLGLIILYGVLVPYFNANPIDFPFSDGIIVADYDETFVRTIVLFVTTIVAGYIPARYIVQKNTLDAILGR